MTGADATPATVSITVNPALPDLADAPAASLVAGTQITAITFANNGGGMLTNCAVDKTLPTGLDLDRTSDNASCEITGTPDAATAVDTYTVTATNATGEDATPATVSITVNPALPDLADAPAATLVVGTEITAITFANSGGGMLTNCAVDKTLPTGLDLDRTSDNASCEITGIPDAVTAVDTYTVTATNVTGADATPATVSITVNPALPDLADAAAATLVAGTAITAITFANNGGGALNPPDGTPPGCTVSPTLPTGLEVSRSIGNGSCEITGTPTAVTSVDTYTVTATNATGSDMATVSITVNPALPDLANAAAATLVVGTEITAIAFANNGGGLLTGCGVNPPLPTGLSLDPTGDSASCEITGIPDAVTAVDTYTVTATNVTGEDATPATVSITVNPALPDLADAAAASLVAGTEITAIAFANNGGGALNPPDGTPPGCTVNPTLPTGLEVSRSIGNGSCEITGTPDAATATATYTVTATNVTGADATPATVSITVNPALPDLADAPAASLVAGTAITAINFVNGGGGMLTGCGVNPPLPTGLSLDPTSDNASCEITGTPDAATATATYTVTATNVTGADATPATVSILVNPALPDLANAPAASLIAGTAITAITFANNGGGLLTGCGVNPPLPTGLSLDPTGDSASCEITGTPDAATAVDTYTVTATNVTGADATPATVSITVVEPVDADGDGLIEIGTLAELNNVRHSLDGTGYKTSADATPDTTGCPSTGCIGYELTADLTFDADGDGSTWTRNSDGSVTLNTGDDNDTYFDVDTGGWVPIGDCGADGICIDRSSTPDEDEAADDAPFTAVFEGNGYTITGLATVRNLSYIGLFGHTNGADIRNLGLVGNLARKAGTGIVYVGGLVGYQRSGTITASHATGDVDGGAGGDRVGGLVGFQSGGAITASHATGNVGGGTGRLDSVGGLVGVQGSGGDIVASYATGDADGGAGDYDFVGGLVGYQFSGSITANYASGDVGGGTGDFDFAGGLVGRQDGGAITASYASGDADGGAGNTDQVGGLVGVQQGNGAITASWGFVSKAGQERNGIDGSTPRPSVTSATGLTLANAGSAWNAAASSTLGAWDFGTASQLPVLRYADYDGMTLGTAGSYTGGHIFHCASDSANAPDDAILIPNCGTLIPVAPIATNVLATTADITVISGTDGTVYIAVLADGAKAPAAADIKAATAGSGGVVSTGSKATVGGRATVSLTGLMGDTAYDVYVVVESSANPPVLGRVTKVDLTTLRVADADSNGLIEIGTLAELNNMRYSLDGSSYKTSASASASPNAIGCPNDVCRGYELMNDLTFDADGDGSTWTRNSDGSVTLDTDDNNDDYFDIVGAGTGGWVPIGGNSNPFTAVFEGNGHTITGLATVRDLTYIGFFGAIGAGADIRNLALVGNLVRKIGTDIAYVGGLVGYQTGTTTITASHAIGDADGGAGGDRVGGLVGYHNGGSITASHAAGNVGGGAGSIDSVGGLVGVQIGGTIIASHASGDVDGGAGRAYVGGLVGSQSSGAITASWASGYARGGDGNDIVGGLVGYQHSGVITAITASYASGAVDGGAGDSDRVGSLVGFQVGGGIGGGITASWGFGSVAGEIGGTDGSNDRPSGITSATGLTLTDAGSAWNAAASNTLDAWDFGTASQPPALNYADYDGATMGTAGSYFGGHRYHCASDSDNAPDDAILIPDCGTLIPVAPTATNVLAATADITVFSGTAGTVYIAVLADGAAAPTAADIKAATAGSGGVVSAGNSAVAAVARTTLSLTGLMGDTAYDVYVVVESSANPPVLGTVSKVDLTTLRVADADADGDGLIDIGTLAQLNNMRYSLDGAGYKASADATPDTTGCPNDVCRGYELMNDLTFDADGDGSTWTRNSDGSVTLDTDDDNDTYFDVDTGGWVPIVDCGPDGLCFDDSSTPEDETADDAPFTAVFEGNGHAITGLATVRDLAYIGLFGYTDGADIRNLGLVGNLAKKAGTSRAYVGGLVGLKSGGAITASHATGDADGGTGDTDDVGGLVGRQDGGTITASHASGDADGGAGDDDEVGGLMGQQVGGSIIASHASGDADGGAGDDDEVGGLVGRQGGVITASYASGDADGGDGDKDYVGGLMGRRFRGVITASWGFGSKAGGETAGSDGSVDGNGDSDLPNGVSSAADLTSANVPASWNAAGRHTLGAWDFGTASQAPRLNRADYDGPTVGLAPYAFGHRFHCANDAANVPADAIVIPDCAVPRSISATNVLVTRADINVTSGTAGTAYVAVLADGAMAPTAADIKAATAGSGGVVVAGNSAATAGTRTTVSLTGLTGDTAYDVYVVVESSANPPVLGTVTKVDLDTMAIVDADGDGLIEIGTLAELNNVRHNLAGTTYRASSSVSGDAGGCPAGVCRGYELTADLDFDADNDGSTWTRNSDGSVILDTGDDNDTYFDVDTGGWVPIGDDSTLNDSTRFTAVFEGNGHTITGPATVRDLTYIGLFGYTDGADISNLGLVGNLARKAGTSGAGVGGLVGQQSGGSITASHATGDADGGGGSDRVGGLVGSQSGGAITASHATGNVGGGAGNYDSVGGLVGAQQGGGAITASYATGDADGGAGVFDFVGGLVGYRNSGAITASYASGDVGGGAGGSDYVGGLVGLQAGGAITSSWGFGSKTGQEINGIDGSTPRPSVTSATGLTLANAGSAWNAAASNTLDAWDFGTSSQAPALNRADYDGPTVGTAGSYTSGHRFHCANDAANVPAGAIIIADCAVPRPVSAANVLVTRADINVLSGTVGTAYIAVLADGAMAPTAADIKAAIAGSGGVVIAGNSAVTAGVRTTVSLTGLMGDTAYDVYVVVESSGVLGRVAKVDLTTLKVADADGNGLIEIGTLAELNNVRYSLDGAGYRAGADAILNPRGCPNDVCRGYELTANLDFDADGDGSTWVRNSDGSVTLDTGDNNDTYFDIASDGSSGGWVPIGDSSNRFTAVFEGNGNTISGLATVRDFTYIGLFGYTDDADIRNLGLVGNLARKAGTGIVYVGGLVGRQHLGTITASYATGDVGGGAWGSDEVGGLVGRQDGGAITASYTTGDVDDGAGDRNSVGGLVGSQTSGSVTASYASGDANGGAGRLDSVGGLVGWQGGSVTASYATGDADGGAGSLDQVGGLVGRQGSRPFVTASWGFGSKTGGETDGMDGSVDNNGDSDLPDGVSSAADLTSANVPASWNEAASSTLGAWNFGTASQTPALNYADYDGATMGTAGFYFGGHRYHCASDSDNAPDDAILIPDCGTLIPGQQRTQPSPAPSGYGSGYVDLSGSSRSSSIQHDFHYASASLWVPEDESGTDKKDTDTGSDENISLIATFDDATDNLAAIRASTGRDAGGKGAASKYALTGIFANPTLANWNNFDGQSDSTHVGSASVSTWEIGTMVEAQAMGSIRVNGVAIKGDYINFLMAGGGAGANVGVSIYAAGADANTGTALVTHSPNFCADKYLKGEQHRAHFDVRALKGKVVDIEIRDHDATNDCGFITFDHFYQSDSSQGAPVGVAAQPDSR